MLTFSWPAPQNILAATPAWERMPIPTMDTFGDPVVARNAARLNLVFHLFIQDRQRLVVFVAMHGERKSVSPS